MASFADRVVGLMQLIGRGMVERGRGVVAC
jgi:hypothetical protein